LSGTCAGHQHTLAQLSRSASIGAHIPFVPPHILASQPGLKMVVQPSGMAMPTTSSAAAWAVSTISAFRFAALRCFMILSLSSFLFFFFHPLSGQFLWCIAPATQDISFDKAGVLFLQL